MAKSGRKPKPTSLKIFEGNPGKRDLNVHEPQSDLPAVKPSAVGMDEIASAEWDRVLAAMPSGIYSALDTAALGTYALAWSMLVKSQREIDENGITERIYGKTKTGETYLADIKVNPSVRTWKAASETLIKMTDRLGLNPSVRSRLQVPSKRDRPQSKFSGLLGADPIES